MGPRVQRPSVAGEKMYGCSLPLSLAGDRSGDPTNSEVLPDDVRGYTFAPQDVSIRQFEGKDDLHGIGYRGMEEIAVLGRRETKRAVHGMRGEVRIEDNSVSLLKLSWKWVTVPELFIPTG